MIRTVLRIASPFALALTLPHPTQRSLACNSEQIVR